MSKVISVYNLYKTYQMKDYSNDVLRNVNFEMEDGEFVSIMGPSGSGKSTLLYTVSGMDAMTSGTVTFNGKDLSTLDKKGLSKLRLLEMGFIFQQMYMMKKLCVLDNIVLPGYQAGRNRNEVNARAEMLMQRLGIADTAMREINEISGGQLQRACLCRALINEPKVIFADEPTGALNSRAAGDVMKELLAANQEGTGILMVTHSARVAAQSDRVIYLVDGDIQGELVLGKMVREEELSTREKMLNSWLFEKGW
ncbi:MAG: ABC transporter ATP-binding protein [Clostridia bacterium]|nr:ABC transporter ATP-binding protein [Clostridia bacterium]MBR2175821.1 ABC transporter ATP-binding protein [Clostridia bacterium]